ncbi:MFS/sugar transport protein [Ceratobasidium sp. AG-Ba]|nr:MFS/sugar transport protein [Ceratobasidium sp. AG-Ba]
MSDAPRRVKGPRWLQIPLVNLPIIVMIAGPLSGLVVQPIIGALADRSTSKWGRRRPYMLSGSLLAALSLVMLSRAQELASWLAGGNPNDAVGFAQAIAILAVYLVDFTINVSMVAARTLAMDVLPTELQSASGVWASRMAGIGAILGFYAGTAPLDQLFPALGKSQVAVLTTIAAICVASTQLITAASVSEAVHIPTSKIDAQSMFGGMFSKGKAALLENLRGIPRDIKSVDGIASGAMGWFPATFFGTVWMGDIYIHQMRRLKGSQAGTDEALRDEAAKAGSNAMFYGAVVLLATGIILPRFVDNPESHLEQGNSRHGGIRPTDRAKTKKLDLVSCWMFANGLLGVLLLCSSFIDTIQGATVIYALMGIHGGIGNWVPYVVIAMAAHKESAQSHLRPAGRQATEDLDIELEGLLEDSAEPTTSPARNHLAGDVPNRIGWFLGLQNVSIVLPMFVCILMSAAIFSILEPGRSVIGGGSTGSPSDKRGRSMDIVLRLV